jgi:transcriptional regulator CtsR
MFSGEGDSAVELRRQELAERFGCAPSQINYVLETRFTFERGYLIESRRGGGGYIRIIRLATEPADLVGEVQGQIGDQLTAREADHLLDRLVEAGLLTAEETGLTRLALSRELRSIPPPVGDVLRAMLLRAVLCVLLADDAAGRRR